MERPPATASRARGTSWPPASCGAPARKRRQLTKTSRMVLRPVPICCTPAAASRVRGTCWPSRTPPSWRPASTGG